MIKRIKKWTYLIIIIGSFSLLSIWANEVYQHNNHYFQLKTLIETSRKNMIFVKGGTFTMGPTTNKWEDGSNYPPHKVTLRSFYISKYNTSYGDYDMYTTATKQKKLYLKAIGTFFRSSNHPVDIITWFQANKYCHWLANASFIFISLIFTYI